MKTKDTKKIRKQKPRYRTKIPTQEGGSMKERGTISPNKVGKRKRPVQY